MVSRHRLCSTLALAGFIASRGSPEQEGYIPPKYCVDKFRDIFFPHRID